MTDSPPSRNPISPAPAYQLHDPGVTPDASPAPVRGARAGRHIRHAHDSNEPPQLGGEGAGGRGRETTPAAGGITSGLRRSKSMGAAAGGMVRTLSRRFTRRRNAAEAEDGAQTGGKGTVEGLRKEATEGGASPMRKLSRSMSKKVKTWAESNGYIEESSPEIAQRREVILTVTDENNHRVSRPPNFRSRTTPTPRSHHSSRTSAAPSPPSLNDLAEYELIAEASNNTGPYSSAYPPPESSQARYRPPSYLDLGPSVPLSTFAPLKPLMPGQRPTPPPRRQSAVRRGQHQHGRDRDSIMESEAPDRRLSTMAF